MSNVKILQIGPDKLTLSQMIEGETIQYAEECDWIVYWYKDEGYFGYGIVAYKKKDNYGWKNLSHCSCCGPGDNGEDFQEADMSLDDLLLDLYTTENDFDHEQMLAVKEFVLKLEK